MKFAFAILGEAYAAETPVVGTAEPEGVEAGAQTHASTEVAHGADEHGGGFPPFNPEFFASQILWLAITFGIFYLIMGRVAIPRIGSVLETRRDRISSDIDEAQRMKEEADAAHAAYEHELAAARGRASTIAQAARDEAKAEAAAERHRVEEELATRMAEAEEKILAIKNQALAEVDRIASETAETIVSELIGKTPSGAEIAAALAAKN